MTKGKRISLIPTWQEAATIIAAALENGTGKGRDMARAELFRMASILDDLKTSETELFEVIAKSANGPAFGVTFTEKATADSYAERLTSRGYEIDPYPAYTAQTDLGQALAQAAEISGDEGLTQ
jgi:hypothetical protein